jgi:agmatine deiminase
MVRLLSPHEEVHINVTGQEMEGRGAGNSDRPWHRTVGNWPSAEAAEPLFFHHNPTNDAWCRDHGPCFIQRNVDGRREEAIVDWGYNAWGGKVSAVRR